jgi:hypothetical protein
MRERLVQVLDSDDDNEPMDVVVRRFWSRTKTYSPVCAPVREDAREGARKGAPAQVVDLAHARSARARGEHARP